MIFNDISYISHITSSDAHSFIEDSDRENVIINNLFAVTLVTVHQVRTVNTYCGGNIPGSP